MKLRSACRTRWSADFGAIGAAAMVKAWFQKYKAVGINRLTIRIDAIGSERLSRLEQTMDLLNSV